MSTTMDRAHRHMRRLFKRGGRAAIAHLTAPQGSRLMLGDPDNGEAVTVTYADGTTVKGWLLGHSFKRMDRRSGIYQADLITVELIVPDDPRLADRPFADRLDDVAWPAIGDGRTREFGELRRHLAGAHGDGRALGYSDAEAIEAHRRDHDTSGNANHADRERLTYSRRAVREAVARMAS